MNTNPQTPTPNNLPIYKTRKFWIVLVILQFIVNLVLFNDFLYRADSVLTFIYSLAGISGATTIGFFTGIILSTKTSSLAATLLFSILVILNIKNFCCEKTFKTKYPILLFITSLISTFLIFFVTSKL